MPRIPRIYVEKALYYVSSVAGHKGELFKDSHDYQAYIDLIKKLRAEYKFKIFAYALSSSRLDLLLELIEGVTISQVMFNLNSTYTKYYNSKYKQRGHLFRQRYRMVLLEKEPYIVPMIIYINRQAPAQNVFNSCNFYKCGQGPLALDFDFRVFNDSFSHQEIDLLSRHLVRQSVIGSEQFKGRVENIINQEKEKSRKKIEGVVMRKKTVLIAVGVLIVLSLSSIFLYRRHFRLSKEFSRVSQQKEAEYHAQLQKEREFIKKDLRELNRADLVSYRAMQKRLEIEKEKNEALEKELNDKENKLDN